MMFSECLAGRQKSHCPLPPRNETRLEQHQAVFSHLFTQRSRRGRGFTLSSQITSVRETFVWVMVMSTCNEHYFGQGTMKAWVNLMVKLVTISCWWQMCECKCKFIDIAVAHLRGFLLAQGSKHWINVIFLRPCVSAPWTAPVRASLKAFVKGPLDTRWKRNTCV